MLLKSLIAAGYGSETGAATRKRAAETGDKLACDYVANRDALVALNDERTARRRWHGSDRPIKRGV